MNNSKSLVTFLVIAFVIAWILFLVPLAFSAADPTTKQLITTTFFALAMWAPGIAAIITTLFVEKQPISSLRLNTLGPKRFYLWAWFLFPALTIVAGLFTVLFGLGKFDPTFSLIMDAMKGAPGAENISPWLIVGAQSFFAITLAPFVNVLFALGEEIGWRGFLLPRLEALGQWKAIVISGVIWGVWHAPAIAQGHNYPGYPILGPFMMIVFCVLLTIILGWMYFNTRSPWVAALGHGSLNAVAGLPVLFMKPGFDTALGGTLASLAGWIPLAIFAAWLIVSKRLPTQTAV
jgi:membrane protease YdiL (CAAX protease family)